MPRSRPNRASPHFISRGHALSESAKVKLFAALGYGSVTDPLVVAKIQIALGIYLDGREHIDNPPRPANYVQALTPIERKARILSEQLFTMGNYYVEKLSHEGVDCNSIAAELLRVAEVSKRVIEQYKGQSSKGAPKETALTETARHLKYIFRSNYRGPKNRRNKIGAFTSLSEYEKKERDFVTTALRDAKIIKANFDVGRLLRDPRCGLLGDRNAITERLAGRAGKSPIPYAFPGPDPQRAKQAVARQQKRSKL